MEQFDQHKNQILTALAEEYSAQFLSQLEPVSVQLGKALYEPGTAVTHVYFPTTVVVSLLYELESGASTEIAVVGNEGVVGVSLFMGGGSTLTRAVAQNAGHALRIKAQALMSEFKRAGPILQLLLRYTQALITQMSQTAVCNRHHSVDQRLCRWLLLSLDRLETKQLTMTHGFIANLLGVRREGVTQAAGNLQRAALIDYERGLITVRDREGLERRTCECYSVVKKEYDRLLPAQFRADNSIRQRLPTRSFIEHRGLL